MKATDNTDNEATQYKPASPYRVKQIPISISENLTNSISLKIFNKNKIIKQTNQPEKTGYTQTNQNTKKKTEKRKYNFFHRLQYYSKNENR